MKIFVNKTNNAESLNDTNNKRFSSLLQIELNILTYKWLNFIEFPDVDWFKKTNQKLCTETQKCLLELKVCVKLLSNICTSFNYPFLISVLTSVDLKWQPT